MSDLQKLLATLGATDTRTLLSGWKAKEVVRQNTLSSNSDVYFYGPDGGKFRSKNDVVRYLGMKVEKPPPKVSQKYSHFFSPLYC